MFKDQDADKKLYLLRQLAEMYLKKKNGNISAIYDILETCLNSFNLKEDDVQRYIDNTYKSCNINHKIPIDISSTLRNLKNVYVISRGIENIIKKILMDYNLKVFGNELIYDGKWKISRNIITADDKFHKMNQILSEYREYKVFTVGNDKNDIKILSEGFPIASYCAEKYIKNFVASRNGIVLKKGNFNELLKLDD